MAMDGLVYIWRPVVGGRHAFAAGAREAAAEATVTSYCGVEVRGADLRGLSELDWIREDSCTTCWRILTDRA